MSRLADGSSFFPPPEKVVGDAAMNQTVGPARDVPGREMRKRER